MRSCLRILFLAVFFLFVLLLPKKAWAASINIDSVYDWHSMNFICQTNPDFPEPQYVTHLQVNVSGDTTGAESLWFYLRQQSGDGTPQGAVLMGPYVDGSYWWKYPSPGLPYLGSGYQFLMPVNGLNTNSVATRTVRAVLLNAGGTAVANKDSSHRLDRKPPYYLTDINPKSDPQTLKINSLTNGSYTPSGIIGNQVQVNVAGIGDDPSPSYPERVDVWVSYAAGDNPPQYNNTNCNPYASYAGANPCNPYSCSSFSLGSGQAWYIGSTMSGGGSVVWNTTGFAPGTRQIVANAWDNTGGSPYGLGNNFLTYTNNGQNPYFARLDYDLSNQPPPPTCSSVSFNPSSLSMNVGASQAVTATANGVANGTVSYIGFSPIDGRVTASPATDSTSPYATSVTGVSVGSSGVQAQVYLTPTGGGAAVLGCSGTVPATVTGPTCTGVTFNPSSMNFVYGGAAQALTATPTGVTNGTVARVDFVADSSVSVNPASDTGSPYSTNVTPLLVDPSSYVMANVYLNPGGGLGCQGSVPISITGPTCTVTTPVPASSYNVNVGDTTIATASVTISDGTPPSDPVNGVQNVSFTSTNPSALTVNPANDNALPFQTTGTGVGSGGSAQVRANVTLKDGNTCTGSTNPIDVVPPPPPPGPLGCTTAVQSSSVAIPDATCGGWGCSLVTPQTVTSNLVVGDNFNLADINVSPLNITHTRDSDLSATLTSPAGTVVQLFNRVGGSGDHFINTYFDDSASTAITSGTAPFTNTFRPVAGPLSNFNGQSTAGTWQLKVTDNANGTTGTLNNWALQLCPPLACTVSLSPNPMDLNVGGINKDLVASVNVTGGQVGKVDFSAPANVSLNPTSDTSSPYSTSVHPVSAGDGLTATVSVKDMDNTTQRCSATSTINVAGPPAWFQTQGGDVHGTGNILSNIPSTATNKNFSMDLNSYPGLISYGGGSATLGSGEASSKKWLANSAYALSKYTYDYFYQKLGSPTVDSFLCSPSCPATTGTYYYSGDVTIANNYSVSGTNKVMVLVNGNLNIDKPISVASGAFLAFIVKGNIDIDKTIGNKNASYPSGTTADVQGLYVTDGQVITADDSSDLTPGKKVSSGGLFYAKGGFSLQRNLKFGGISNDTIPAELFIFRPDLVMNAPFDLWTSKVSWGEVAP